MHRLFVAIQPPPALRDALRILMGGVANARWQDDEQLHLTLRFIGEVDRHRAEDIAAALGRIHQPRFALSLDRIGHFERKGRIEALWVGVAPHEPLHALHNKIDRALQGVGVPPEERSYLPHVTIARFGRHGGGPINAFLEGAIVPAVSASISEFRLYESTLGQQGSHYSVVTRYPLD